MIARWFRQRAERRRLEVADADDLMSYLDGMAAYGEARNRGIDVMTGKLLDPSRPPLHWHRVRSIIRKRIGYEPVGAGMHYPEP